ncbi:MazG nucleotide pyrophosphohydrolase domain-containing protein [Dongshaea marina]|uniref:MazG nucleotide pyrophosphohydrolase domain-containing protein n=1 Tax=Dongshaea marina TaxID=2047966 RepID=UPI00131F1A26|nr:MazG nucleotide pyrophosphohydrolase domain-containing protein [Dongshaea marina]
MTAEQQSRVAAFTDKHSLENDPTTCLLDLVSETGELAKEILQGSQYGQTKFQPASSWQGELGDLFYSLICLANSTQVNLDTALVDTLDKYQARIKRKGSPGSDKS